MRLCGAERGEVVTGCARREAIGLAERDSANPEGAARARAHFVSPRSSKNRRCPERFADRTGNGTAILTVPLLILGVPNFKMVVPFSGFGGNNATKRAALMIEHGAEKADERDNVEKTADWRLKLAMK